MEVANARIPYASTFVQTHDDVDEESLPLTEFEKATDMSILYEKPEKAPLEKVLNLHE